jgi:hypothetical protein
MKLYNVPRNTRVQLDSGLELNFHHTDGMYSYCEDDEGNVYHLAAWTEVTIQENKNETKRN